MATNPSTVRDTPRAKPASEIRASRKGMAVPDDALSRPVRRRGMDNPRFDERAPKHAYRRND